MATATTSMTALQLYKRSSPRTFTTGCSGLDSFLGGGMPTQGLTEICGESGAGKTQLCMQLLLTAQRSINKQGLNGKTLFLSCEGQFPILRLQEIARRCAADDVAAANADASASTTTTNTANTTNTVSSTSVTSTNAAIDRRAQELIDNVLITHIEDADQLMDVMTVTLPMELRRGLVKLVVVDSIAAVCRGHFDNGISGLTERADVLVSMAAYMKQMSDRYGCAFVVVNQVSACFQMGHVACDNMAASFIPNGQEPPPERPKKKKKLKRKRRVTAAAAGAAALSTSFSTTPERDDDDDSGGETSRWDHVPWKIPLPTVSPALGLTWTSCVNTRIMLTRGHGGEDMDGFLRRREMRLLLSSTFTCGTMCHYHVNTGGVERVEDEMMVSFG